MNMITACKGLIGKVLNRSLSSLGLQIRRIGSGPWDRDPVFLEQFKTIEQRTVVKIDRSYMLYQYANYAAKLPQGDVAQLGVYKGGTAKMIAECFKRTNKNIYLFDTFEGLPPSSQADGKKNQALKTENDFNDVDFREVEELFRPYTSVVLKKGFFPQTAHDLTDARFSFVYLDADLYQSTKDGLNFFYPRMLPGGVIMLDDYGTPIWPGIQKAVQEFCEEQNISAVSPTWWQGLIIKGA